MATIRVHQWLLEEERVRGWPEAILGIHISGHAAIDNYQQIPVIKKPCQCVGRGDLVIRPRQKKWQWQIKMSSVLPKLTQLTKWGALSYHMPGFFFFFLNLLRWTLKARVSIWSNEQLWWVWGKCCTCALLFIRRSVGKQVRAHTYIVGQ